MLNSPLLDVAISLIFIYLLVALMVTGVTEFVFTFRRTKSKLLKNAIQKLFYDEHWREMSGKIIDSPFIQVLKRNSNEFPAFIPPKVFVSALLDIITVGTPTIEAINTYLEKDKDSAFSRWLKMELAQCDQNVDKLKENLEHLFDNAMDRVTGWYTRNAKLWSLGVALVICAGMNIDSIDIIKYFFDHPEKATEMADSGAQFVKDNKLDELTIVSGGETIVYYEVVSKDKEDKNAEKDKTKVQSTPKAGTDSVSATVKATADASTLKTATIKLQQQPIPLGWNQFKAKFNKTYYCKDVTYKSKETTSAQNDNKKAAPDKQTANDKSQSKKKCWGDIFGLLFLKVLGILASAAAASIGAPFWFDLLEKLTPLRKKQNITASSKTKS